MSKDTAGKTTRRDYLRLGGAAVAGTLFAGCLTDASATDDQTDGTTSNDTETDATTSQEADDGSESSDAGPYSVAIEPMGRVEFESVPETWVANNGSWTDMGIALGLEPPEGVWLPGRYHTQYYDEIPDVSVDVENIRQLWGDSGVGKEQFYALDADVHIMDPNFLVNRGQWKQADVEEITSTVAPMFGNSIFSRGYAWHQDYRYYSLYEAFEKLAQVFRRTERFEAFESLHADFQSNLAPVVPARSERPSVATVWGGGDEPEEFYPYVVDDGTSFKHFTDLQLEDALANSDVKNFYSNRGAIDYETLLEVDPGVLMVRGQEAKSRDEFRNTVVGFMAGHDVASELTAVKNDDVYRAGSLYQGPITNLVLTERVARELYDVDEELFDRQRVADIVNGDV